MVWTLHDMWPFTGGCHYDDGCGQFKDRCGKCPKLTSDREYDLSRWVWARKNKHWNAVPLTIVSPSNWLADSAKRSSLFKNKTITVIPNGVDTTIYKPIEKRSARRILGLPETGRFILFGAMNSTSDFRKGFHLLLPALRALADADLSMNTELLVFGGTIADNAIDCGFPVRSLGFFQDDVSLALLYSAADVFVAPSLQENLANTVMEAMACGTPCVAFRVGGMPDMIDHMGTGYLCEPHSVEDLTYGIRWVLEGEERMHHLSGCSRDRAASKFNLESISLQYKSVYNALLNGDIEQSK
jgi:glycosyltransferase involved in cell wall biosynthesis